MQHSELILNVLKNNNVSAYKIAKETGISESLFSKWKKNPTSEISSINLTRIADYLNCSVDYLLGRSINDHENDGLTAKDRCLLNAYIDADEGTRQAVNKLLDI